MLNSVWDHLRGKGSSVPQRGTCCIRVNACPRSRCLSAVGVLPVSGMQSGTRAWAVPLCLYVNISVLQSDGKVPDGWPLGRNLPLGRYSSCRKVFWFSLLRNVGSSCWFFKDNLLYKPLHFPTWAHPVVLARMSLDRNFYFSENL